MFSADFNFTPPRKALGLAIAAKSPMGAYYQENLSPDNCSVDAIHYYIQARKGRIVNTDTTRFVTYGLINSKLVS